MDVAFLQYAHTLVQKGLDLLFPPRCAGCQRGGSFLCSFCWQTMQPLTRPFCDCCGSFLHAPDSSCLLCQYHRSRLHGLRCANIYHGPLRKAIHALKYNGQQRLAEPLGLLLARTFRHYNLDADGIIPLPLHPQRQQQRGYNQATLLARVCAAHLKIPCLEDLVTRQRSTPPQVGLGFHERRENMAGAFALAPDACSRLVGHQALLLIDDVSTTGATLEACAAPLYMAGVTQVRGLVLAKPANSAHGSQRAETPAP